MGNVQRDTKAHSAKNRPARIPLGQGSKLSLANQYATDKTKHYHLFLDKPGELESAKRAWYDHVKDENGSNVQMPAGNGQNHFLMQIDKKLYQEDMLAQQKLVTAATKQKISINKGAGEYSPEGHKTSVTRDI